MNRLSRTTRRCRYEDCPSHHARSRARIHRHAGFQIRKGRRRRLACQACNRTYVKSRGTLYHRMRHPRLTIERAVHLQVEGMTKAAIARVLEVHPSTVARWLAKAADHARRFEEEYLEVSDAVELQLDELKSYGAAEHDRVWVYNALEVWSRVWVASLVGRRTFRSTLVFSRRIKAVCAAPRVPTVVTTDEFKYYPEALRRTFGSSCVVVQVKNRYGRGRIVRTRWRLVLGPEWRYDLARERLEDGTRPNTSYVERLQLFERRSCSYLHRRTPAPMRNPARLEDRVDVLRNHHNFVRPHSTLRRLSRGPKTPAMQAEIFDRPLSFREIFSWVPPPRRRSLSPRVMNAWIP